jgi:hypothetical protein
MAIGIGQRTLIYDQGDSLLRKRVRWPSESLGKMQIGGVTLSPGSSYDFTIPELLSAGLLAANFADTETANFLYYVGMALHPTLGTSIGDLDDGTGSGAVAAATSSSPASGSGK